MRERRRDGLFRPAREGAQRPVVILEAQMAADAVAPPLLRALALLGELCAMGGITLEDLSQSVACREILGQGRQEGCQEGRQEGLREGRQESELR